MAVKVDVVLRTSSRFVEFTIRHMFVELMRAPPTSRVIMGFSWWIGSKGSYKIVDLEPNRVDLSLWSTQILYIGWWRVICVIDCGLGTLAEAFLVSHHSLFFFLPILLPFSLLCPHSLSFRHLFLSTSAPSSTHQKAPFLAPSVSPPAEFGVSHLCLHIRFIP
ncbi:hypothetical protein PIB30_055901 [Stylosanthes scabra]|uniref:Uncharacterized protein n=1 Tax=Stylosanthes scabra TaxID=79078 RepID=A0ABU6RJ99_9FABA|nr:hypothetical protein [Stylosanthes scabra]